MIRGLEQGQESSVVTCFDMDKMIVNRAEKTVYLTSLELISKETASGGNPLGALTNRR